MRCVIELDTATVTSKIIIMEEKLKYNLLRIEKDNKLPPLIHVVLFVLLYRQMQPIC
ncbi:hypothetical protein D3C80_2082520 [compost metagenome]